MQLTEAVALVNYWAYCYAFFVFIAHWT